MRTTAQLINEIERSGKMAAGRKDLINHLSGKRITQRQAIQATCYECQGYCSDGREDCEKSECPLYPFSQFNSQRRKSRAKTPQKILQE
jgi:hypothetical protein